MTETREERLVRIRAAFEGLWNAIGSSGFIPKMYLDRDGEDEPEDEDDPTAPSA